MSLQAYARATSCPQGGRLEFVIGSAGHRGGTVRVLDAVDGTVVHEGEAAGPRWWLTVGEGWRSSLYRAVFEPGEPPGDEVYFAVRPAAPPAAPVLLSVPFATWQAYNRAGRPGESPYWTESPDRAARVSFDRPGGGPPPEEWEAGVMRWLRGSGWDVDYCSNLDLHLVPGLLRGYRLLVVPGHDEYWTARMRDAVESWTRAGGNVAFLGANTAWWQMRLEDGGRTLVCYRDAAADPVVRAGRPDLATVEWSSAPASRPENAMTGLSYRLGAGCWVPDMAPMRTEAYTARFADHWAFDGTGLADGDSFGRGCLGYETDAADIEEIDGVPRATGRDGTPASFTVLATADLRHWDAYGQGGAATMGVFTAGAGTVFNAGTVCWGAALEDPVVARITANVVGRLAAGPAGRGWTAAGDREDVRALAGAGPLLFAVLGDGRLAWREACAQNLRWTPIGHAEGARALAVPRDAVDGGPRGLYALDDCRVLVRAVTTAAAPWRPAGACPPAPRSLAAVDGRLFALDGDGALWTCPLGGIPAAADGWLRAEADSGLSALAAVNGRLFGVRAGRLVSRPPAAGACWTDHDDALGATALAGQAGGLYGAAPGQPLRRWTP